MISKERYSPPCCSRTQCIFVYSIFFITSAGSNAESICYLMYRYKTFPWDLLPTYASAQVPGECFVQITCKIPSERH